MRLQPLTRRGFLIGASATAASAAALGAGLPSAPADWRLLPPVRISTHRLGALIEAFVNCDFYECNVVIADEVGVIAAANHTDRVQVIGDSNLIFPAHLKPSDLSGFDASEYRARFAHLLPRSAR